MTEHFDVAIIGGGIHGAGIAQAAAAAGYTALVMEKSALAAGTSSRSSKLIHGGLRYLESHDFSLVRESLQERTLLLRNAPDLVQLRPFHIPVYADTSRRPFTIRTGLLLYAALGGGHRSSRFRKLPARDWDTLDGLETRRLQAVYRYYDAQTHDADLTRAVMHSAMELGAVLYCPAEFLGAEIHASGCDIRYSMNGTSTSCTATTLVNATGPWVDRIAAMISPAPEKLAFDLVQGTHLVVEGTLRQGAYYLEVPADRRAIFLLPWGRHALLGTTEHSYTGAPEAVTPPAGDEAYLLQAMQHYFPQRSLQVLERFAGLRVLPASGQAAFGRSRETRLPVDNPRQPRLISVYGGKLTGYRATASKVIRILRRTLPARKPVAQTAHLRLTRVE